MNPTVDLRLVTMMRALQDVILPALANNGFAADQAKLMLGHLNMLRLQVDDVAYFEQLELRAARDLAARLVAAVDGGDETHHAVSALKAALALGGGHPREVRASRDAINGAIDTLVQAASTDGSADFLAEAQRLVIRGGTESANRNRSFFAASGFEGDGGDIPAIADMLADFARAYPEPARG